MARAGALIVREGRVLLIERRPESDNTYYLFPGGRIEPNETAEEALVRELREELGLTIVPGRLVAAVTYNGDAQYYYTANLIGHELSFNGDEAESGVWLPIDSLTSHSVHPAAVAGMVEASTNGWPNAVISVVDQGRFRPA
jgi:mutator protein MutT